MRKRTQNCRFGALLLTAALLAAVLVGCTLTGENSLGPARTDNAAAISEQNLQPAEPTVSGVAEQTPPVSAGPVAEAIPNPSPEPAATPEPSPAAAPEPSPAATPEPSPAATPEPEVSTPTVPEQLVADSTVVEAELEDEAAALSDAPPAVPMQVSAKASGIMVKENDSARMDYSNTADGYVMVQYTAQSEHRLKVQVKGPATTYTYNLTPGQWEVFPLSDGSGAYQITLYQNVTGTRYAAVLALNTQVELKDEFAPFLHSNQYVNYDNAPNTVAAAARLVGTREAPLEKVEAVYDFVVKGMTYDKQLAATVKSGYLPVLDAVLEKKSGICFDYAALMTGMLRSQGVPCKLVVGYAGTAYHAWISVWVEGSGWVDGVIWFDGVSWQRMDPTFASSADSSESILKYIGDGTNYTAKYFY